MKTLQLIGAFCAGIFISTTAFADIIYDNGVNASSGDCSGAFTCRYALSDDFMLSAGATTISDVHWVGSYSSLIDVTADDFVIGFYNSVAGTPSDTAFATYNIGSVSRTDLGAGAYAYDAVIADLALSANTQYFISIANNANPFSGGAWAWYWYSNGIGNGDGFYKDTSLDSWTTREADFQFQLTGTPAVPVPAAFWLFGSGLIGLLGLARRQSSS